METQKSGSRIFAANIPRKNFLSFNNSWKLSLWLFFFFRTLWRHGPNAASTFTSTFCQEVSSSSWEGPENVVIAATGADFIDDKFVPLQTKSFVDLVNWERKLKDLKFNR
jgi:hypothetical protein